MFIYILLGLVLLTSWGQCQSLPPERPTDTKVVQFEPIPEAVDGNCTYNPGPKKFASFLFRINRVVGGANAIDSQGRLLNPEALIRDGIVSRFAEMKFRVSDLPYTVRPRIGSFGAAAVLEVNGQKVKDAILTRYNGTIEVAVKVPISYLKFGQRIPGLSPVPGVNLATVTMNTARLPQIGPEPSVECGAEIREFFFEPRYLRFDALAPIFLVHGNNECPAFFKDSGRCLPPNHQDRYRFNFESALQELAMPYTVGREMKPHTVAVHARQLVSIVGDQAREFGSKHFHIIAHSKGGLDSREYFLTINRAKAEPGPYSLVTLDTPHLGSPGSDYM